MLSFFLFKYIFYYLNIIKQNLVDLIGNCIEYDEQAHYRYYITHVQYDMVGTQKKTGGAKKKINDYLFFNNVFIIWIDLM